MIVFQSRDKKVQAIINELASLGIEGYALNPRISILYPFRLLILLAKKKRIKVYVFRYLNDKKSLTISLLYCFSDLLMIFILKTCKINIFWLCHNIDKETRENHKRITKFRRYFVSKYAKVIFTTNELLVYKAKELFPKNKIDFLSLGYIEGGIHRSGVDMKSQNKIEEWILSRKNQNSKFIFCIGRPAPKSLHFKLVTQFVRDLNRNSKMQWYCIVVGGEVNSNKFIFNIPHISVLEKSFIQKYSDFFYRVIDDYSMSYSTYEAVHLRIPTITENYGILPRIIENYKIGVVISPFDNYEHKILTYNKEICRFQAFEKENNWGVAARKLKSYYDIL